jgi:hypothetical protein
MIQVLGFHAPVDLQIGTVFCRSQFINPAIDPETQSLIQDHGGTSMALYAVHCGAARVLEALLLMKADVNIADNCGVTPLLLAAYRSDAVGTRMLSTILKHAARCARTHASRHTHTTALTHVLEYALRACMHARA